MTFIPIRFIAEKIEVCFDSPPLLEKKPGCPDGFSWRGISFNIVEILAEWHDYQRKGRMSKNMKPTHAKMATVKGSWGVGQDYFRVRTHNQRIFDIYYDRAPQGVNHRKGAWFVYRELTEDQ